MKKRGSTRIISNIWVKYGWNDGDINRNIGIGHDFGLPLQTYIESNMASRTLVLQSQITTSLWGFESSTTRFWQPESCLFLVWSNSSCLLVTSVVAWIPSFIAVYFGHIPILPMLWTVDPRDHEKWYVYHPHDIASGSLLHSCWKWPIERDDLPTINCDVPYLWYPGGK